MKDTSGPAFPGAGSYPGMTRRQWLAGLAMQAYTQISYGNEATRAVAAYAQADAMLEFEEKEKVK